MDKLKERRWSMKCGKRDGPHGKNMSVVKACRYTTRKAKALLEFNFAKDIKDNKIFFFFLKYINSKRKTRKNMVPY